MDNTHFNFELSNKQSIYEFDSEWIELETNHVTGENNESNGNMLQKKANRQTHTREAADNGKNKILGYSLKFDVEFLNLIVKETLGDDYDFRTMEIFEFNHNFKKYFSRKKCELLKSNSIYSFLCEDKNINTRNISNHNKNAFNFIINKNESLKNIFEKSCFEFFSIFYYKRIEFDMSKYGINKIIDLSNLKYFYEDAIKKNYIGEEKYITKLEKIIKKNFLKNYFIVKKGK